MASQSVARLEHPESDAIDHKALVAGLPPATRKALCAQSTAAGLLQAGGHLGAIAALMAYVAMGLPLWWAAMLPLGILIVFLFTGLHECIHRTAFKADWLNDLCAWAFGFAVFLPPVHFRYFHMAHHRHTHDPDHDPELAAGKPEGRVALVLSVSGLADWRWRVRALVRHALGFVDAPYIPARGRARVVAEARIALAAYALLLGGSILLDATLLLWLWIVPILLGNPFLRIYLMAEHTRCPHVANMLQNTRTTFASRFVRWLAWNMPYHAEHHAYPAVPFHRLPDLHALARGHLTETAPSHGGFLLSEWRRAG